MAPAACGPVADPTAVAPGTPRTDGPSAGIERSPAGSTASPGAVTASPAATPRATASPAASLPEWTWTRGALPQQGWRGPVSSIFALDGAFVGIQTRYRPDNRLRGFVLRSEDGLAWTEVDVPVARFYYETGVVSDGVLTIVVSVGTAQAPVRQLWQTRDGLRWTRLKGVEGLGFGAGQVLDLGHAESGWMALALQRIDAENAVPRLFRSTDLRAWAEVPMPDGATAMGLATDGQRWLLAGAGFSGASSGSDLFTFTVFVSEDGRSWTMHPVADLPWFESAAAIAGSAQGFAIGGQRFDPSDESSHPIGWWSRDGMTWRPAAFVGLSGEEGAAQVNAIVAGQDGFVASGSGDSVLAAAWTSEDGARWTQVHPLPMPDEPDMRAVVLVDGELIVSGQLDEDTPWTTWRGVAEP